MNNPASELAKKRWSKVKKEDRSNAMRKVRGSFDFSNVILKITPQKIDATKLEEMANGTDKGMEYSIMLALSDGESRTKREINSMVEKIMITSAIELNRRKFQIILIGLLIGQLRIRILEIRKHLQL